MLKKLGGGGKSQSSKRGKESKSNEKDQSKSTSTESTSSGPRKELLMRAIVATSEGQLKVQLVPRPVPKAKEVLVKVDYAGVNGPDVEESKHGKSPQIKELEEDGTKSKYLGLECSATISALGEGISKKDKQIWKKDTKVCAIVFGGAYAEYVAVPVGHLLKFTTKITVKQAAAIPQAACTVWSELFMKKRLDEGLALEEEEGSRLSSGETVLIHGGCSGIGIFAIQMAKHQGAIVFATAGTDAKIAECKRLGADLCINYNKNDFVEVIRDSTKGQGVDVILDCVGFKYFQRNLECLKEGGRLVQIGGCWMTQYDSYGKVQKLFSNFKCIDVAALVYRTPEMKTSIVEEVQGKVMPAIENGDVKLVIHKVFTFEEAAEAHKLKKSGNHIGKILLQP